MEEKKVSASAQLLSMEILEQAAECLRTLAHPHRLRIVQILLDHEESVGELARACELPSHMVSEHLRLLKDRGFLESRRDGRKVFYSIAEPALASIMHCIEERFGSSQQSPTPHQ
ncbi:ArsR/SmtB family transcription factor [Desulfurivibrio alkaliphilus]|nr:metalloregulator ArsR/SmtB family transcription factor [Desulfurivibrio alkaliphilus]